MGNGFDRRSFLKAAAAGAAVTGFSRSGERPNILWLVSEDNSPWFGCYGDPLARTPNFDRLAQESVVFDNAFANVPVCAPARSTLHTGMYATCLGTQHMRSMNPLPPNVRFFTSLLREAGYYCINHSKTDYNTTGTPQGAWDRNGFFADFKNRRHGMPFFSFMNFMTTHESSLHSDEVETITDPQKVRLAPYHPDTPVIRRDYARYYDRIARLDKQVGDVLNELEAEGLLEDTIVFYFSDHGGVLPRSKRFLYDSGMRVPFMVRVPRKYRELAPGPPGSRTSRLVSFIDFAPTALSIAGVPAPDYMQGRAFMGKRVDPEPTYVYGFRGRMDERYDMSRAVRDRRFKYIRNYFPHLPRGRRLDYLWKMDAMRSWEELYQEGALDPVQSRFFQAKPPEELYDLESDPYEINNLAGAPDHAKTLARLRQAHRDFVTGIRDTGFLQEAEMFARSQGGSPFVMAQDPASYDLERIMKAAEAASSKPSLETLEGFMKDKDSGVRYWGVTGCCAREDCGRPAMERLTALLADESESVRIATAEALARMGEKDKALPALKRELVSSNMYAVLYASDAIYNAGLELTPAFELLRRSATGWVENRIGLNALR